jgi:hypothetical protein
VIEFVVSLTSYPTRFRNLGTVLHGISHQTLTPYEVHLNIASEDWRHFPFSLLEEPYKFRLTINLCQDLGPGKKLIPTLLREKSRPIITIDDDLILESDLFSKLIETNLLYPEEVIASRVHYIHLSTDGYMAPYETWIHNYQGDLKTSLKFFPTSGSGMLIPAGSLDGNVTNINSYIENCWHTDDLWYFWHMKMQGTACRRILGNSQLKFIPGTQTHGLWLNGNRERNDLNILKMHTQIADVKSLFQ